MPKDFRHAVEIDERNGNTKWQDATKLEREEVLPIAHRLVELILDQLIAPYVRSLCPVYAQTVDHALLICGRSETDEGIVHFVHDDQIGPYLAAPSLLAMSRAELVAASS